MNLHETFMRRCFDLARLGAGSVSPNPMVGAVLVHQNRIIGEGFHQQYGQAHAEVNAVNSVHAEDRRLLREATLYVSLEPCCIFGKTPPCTNLILENHIPRVVISCLDQTPGVAGKGVEVLRAAGVEVICGVLEAAGQRLSAVRNTFVSQHRPYILLKFAKTSNNFFCPEDRSQFWITNKYAKRLVHRWRSETDAILVGTNTALHDNPELTNRLYFGKSPLRVVLDRTLRLPKSHAIFDGTFPTLIFTEFPTAESGNNLEFVGASFGTHLLQQVLAHLAERKCTSLIVEGGAQLLQTFIEAGLWDEARVFTGLHSSLPESRLVRGIPAPVIPAAPAYSKTIAGDLLEVFFNPHSLACLAAPGVSSGKTQ
ncbi:MAG: bifunctional diaminohydroxyphosphoribosylaminopyrimidine deaminase/5-amino-6-(5-phosphoribosylamino)uracil reductase RibD [Saprospiraceae bacterium]|nr:bifunctional diaminohydroxyphosphoribosylaminopyrimidine deaminase/5-amino-6-(5-phosphoribosylamino)uracil reductase RibD [Saprospiraceae bacterium]